MKRFAIFAGALLALASFDGLTADNSCHKNNWHWTNSSSSSSSSGSVSSSSHEKYKNIGDFPLIGFARFKSVILNDNMVYKPYKKYKKKVKEWQLQDSIRVLQTEHRHLVLLINLRTGKAIKAKRHEVRK